MSSGDQNIKHKYQKITPLTEEEDRSTKTNIPNNTTSCKFDRNCNPSTNIIILWAKSEQKYQFVHPGGGIMLLW